MSPLGSSFVFTVLNMPEIARRGTEGPPWALGTQSHSQDLKQNRAPGAKPRTYILNILNLDAESYCGQWSIVPDPCGPALCVLIQLIYSDFSQRLR